MGIGYPSPMAGLEQYNRLPRYPYPYSQYAAALGYPPLTGDNVDQDHDQQPE